MFKDFRGGMPDVGELSGMGMESSTFHLLQSVESPQRRSSELHFLVKFIYY